MRASLGGVIGGLLAALVANVCAAVVGGVGVHDFAVEARVGDTQAIAFADHGGGVDDGDNEVFGIFAAADERENAVGGVVRVDAFEPVPVMRDLMEGGFGGVVIILIVAEMLDAAIGTLLQ